MREINITGEQFDNYVDFSQANFFFDAFSENEKFEVKAWGITLMPQLGIDERHLYVPSVSSLIFEDVAHVILEYGVYNEQGNGFIKNLAGDNTLMQLSLGKRENLSGYTRYFCSIGGYLGRYIGWGELTLYARGEIKLIYDEETVIDATDYCHNPKKYTLPFC